MTGDSCPLTYFGLFAPHSEGASGGLFNGGRSEGASGWVVQRR